MKRRGTHKRGAQGPSEARGTLGKGNTRKRGLEMRLLKPDKAAGARWAEQKIPSTRVETLWEPWEGGFKGKGCQQRRKEKCGNCKGLTGQDKEGGLTRKGKSPSGTEEGRGKRNGLDTSNHLRGQQLRKRLLVKRGRLLSRDKKENRNTVAIRGRKRERTLNTRPTYKESKKQAG